MKEPEPPATRGPCRKRVGGCLLLLLVAAGAWTWTHRSGGSPPAVTPAQTQGNGQGAAAAPPIVHTAVVENKDFPVYLRGLGTVQAWNVVTVRSRVDGQVEKVLFAEGQQVNEGDTLIELDSRPFKAALDQANAKIAQDGATLTGAKADLARTSSLVGNGYATKQLFDQQTATVNQLAALVEADKAALENTNVSLGYTTIKAPLTGRIGLRTIDIGNIVHAADANGIVTITQTKPIAVSFTAPESDLPAIVKAVKAGPMPLTALSPDGAAKFADGTLSIINNEVDTGSGTIRLKGRFENLDETLWPGLSVTTQLLVSTLHDAIVVPEAAVQHGPQGLFAYVVGVNGTAEKRDIKLGPTGNGEAVVQSGLTPGEQVVTSGQYRVLPGSLVTVNRDGAGPNAISDNLSDKAM